MERTIFDIMSHDPSRVADFSGACDEMLASQYILADGRVSAILMSIATSKTLYSLIERLLQKFDYRRAAKTCQRDEFSKIKLPESEGEAVAFVFCVLLDIDKHIIELRDFLQFFQKDCEPALAYKSFLSDFIAPFKQGVLSLLESDKKAAENARNAQDKENERRRLRLNFDRFMGTFVARINSDDSLGTILKDDLTVLCYSFSDAVHAEDSKASKSAYLALVKKLRTHLPALARELEKLDIESA